jgi:hypothetical protein
MHEPGAQEEQFDGVSWVPLPAGEGAAGAPPPPPAVGPGEVRA